MKTFSKRKRPGVLVRFYPDDLARLNKVAAEACTPRENYIKRAVMDAVNASAIWQAAEKKALTRKKRRGKV